MKAIHIVDGPPLYTNCFLIISDAGHAVAVDPAAEARRFEEALEENGATLSAIFLTHGHHDHVGSVEPLRAKYGAKVYLNEADAKQFGIKADESFTDGQEIVLDELRFKVYSTPGHTPGSVCIEIGDLLFTGDTLFAGDIGRTDFPGGDQKAMRESLKKLRDTVPGDPQVLPGHEEFSSMEQERKNNPYLRQA
ncbi:MBL fold metallo-hydrolase [Ruminococcaceae bacterium OttesenSCG-928-D13]|nr:MBL fold metallo-hydrolase [Ruminococcaceae bacterium OttesenSCG-928-D13]